MVLQQTSRVLTLRCTEAIIIIEPAPAIARPLASRRSSFFLFFGSQGSVTHQGARVWTVEVGAGWLHAGGVRCGVLEGGARRVQRPMPISNSGCRVG